ncbi:MULTISPECIES: hypothetical protein [Cysteiniphilum]|uniref:Uncharacterized protein n=1 Tax=Cysteiniphilum litorale TaxID=2056700 RepID=A0A8J2Z584_9GAMM|nr:MULTISPECIES: hypothetical protein [Cysteiniphilum]WHN66312.1 hypothetical protein NYP54_03520 [Cysteiniphilum sp. QT6929]GGF99804.1 hypothetical protein GCM10010995_16360 [Cysteiniphilum litorale]
MSVIDEIYHTVYQRHYRKFLSFQKRLRQELYAKEAWYSHLLLDGTVYNLPLMSKEVSEIWYSFDDKIHDKSYVYEHMLGFGKYGRYTDVLTQKNNERILQFDRYMQQNPIIGSYNIFIKHNFDASISLLGVLSNEFINLNSPLNHNIAHKIMNDFEAFFHPNKSFYEACNISADLIALRDTPRILDRFFAQFPEIQSLSMTDILILKALYFGDINANDIALTLKKSRRTIENRLEYIRECLGCSNKYELYHLVKSMPEIIAYVFIRLKHLHQL